MSGQGKVLLVTGGARGIGRAVVLQAAAAGYRVAFSYLSDDAAAESVLWECEAAGREAMALRSDVADGAAVCSMFQAVDARFGRLDAVVRLEERRAGTEGVSTGRSRWERLVENKSHIERRDQLASN